MMMWNSLRTALRGRPQPRHGRFGEPQASQPAFSVPSSSSAFSRPLTTLDKAAGLSATASIPVQAA